MQNHAQWPFCQKDARSSTIMMHLYKRLVDGKKIPAGSSYDVRHVPHDMPYRRIKGDLLACESCRSERFDKDFVGFWRRYAVGLSREDLRLWLFTLCLVCDLTCNPIRSRTMQCCK